MSLRESIKQKQKESKHFIWNGVEVFIKDPITNPKISIKNILNSIGNKIPDHLLSNIDTIYIGQFDFLKLSQFSYTLLTARISPLKPKLLLQRQFPTTQTL